MTGSTLVSGGSGFLGSYIIEEMLEAGYGPIYVVARADSDEACAKKLAALWHGRPALRSALGERVVAIAGNVSRLLVLQKKTGQARTLYYNR